MCKTAFQKLWLFRRLAFLNNRLVDLWRNRRFVDRSRVISAEQIDLIQRGARLGRNIFIGQSVYFEMENVQLLIIEDGVVVSSNTKFIFHDSSLANTAGYATLFGQIVLRKNCYIGADTILLAGTEVGKNTIVGAGSLVKGILKPDSVYMGRPARYYCSVAEMKYKWQYRRMNSKQDRVFYVPAKAWYIMNEEETAKFVETKNSSVDELNSIER